MCPHQGVSGELVTLQLLLTVNTRQTHTPTVAPVRQQTRLQLHHTHTAGLGTGMMQDSRQQVSHGGDVRQWVYLPVLLHVDSELLAAGLNILQALQ